MTGHVLTDPVPLAGAVVVRHGRAARRLRVQLPELRRGDERAARRLERALCDSGVGIEQVRVDPMTRRALIVYAPGSPLADTLRDLADRRDAAPDPAARAEAPGRREGQGRLRRRSAPSGGIEHQADRAWHADSIEQVFAALDVDRHGLDQEEAADRRQRLGPNVLEEVVPRSRLAIMLAQLDNVPAKILLGSSALSALTFDFLDSIGILAAVGIDSVFGYRIEQRNEALLAAWSEIEAGEARVLRDGAIGKIPATDLVPGDLLLVRSDELVPADARVIDAHRLSCNEAILTGESVPCAKSPEPVAEDAPLAEREGMLYSGTTVASGRGRAVVVATGDDTEAARIRRLVEFEQPPPTPFERRMESLSTKLALAGAGAGAATAGLSILRGRPPGTSVRSAVALAVAAIPEGLPMVSTAALVRSMERMRERDMVVRRLVSAETLGGVTVVCADKTGTLTRNEMVAELIDLGRGEVQVEEVVAKPEKVLTDPATLILAGAVLNSDLDLHRQSDGLGVSGSPTEKALLRAAEAAGLDGRELQKQYRRKLLHERRAGVHYVVSCHGTPDAGDVAFVKGAPGQVLGLCDQDLQGPLDADRKQVHRDRNVALAEEGMRVLAVAWRRVEQEEDLRGGYTFLGFIGLRDPLREGAAETVRAAAASGIRTVILTGDQVPTARAVARAVGLEGEVLRGDDLEELLALDGEEALRRVEGVAAVARVTSAQKAAFVRALREAGEVVAMAGDGLNDAPAIRAADVGIAIGSRASNVSREAADIVLASEDLPSVLAAVGEGRVVQDNLRRSVRYLLSTNLSESMLALGSVTLGAPDPFTPMRLLWLNLVTDSLPAVALAIEPADGDVLARPPAPPDAPLIDAESRRLVTRDALSMTGLATAFWPIGGPPAVFSALVGSQLGYAFACRSQSSSEPDERFIELVGAAAALHLAGICFPPVRMVLQLPPIVSMAELAAFGVGFALPYSAAHPTRHLIVERRGSAHEADRAAEGTDTPPESEGPST